MRSIFCHKVDIDEQNCWGEHLSMLVSTMASESCSSIIFGIKV